MRKASVKIALDILENQDNVHSEATEEDYKLMLKDLRNERDLHTIKDDPKITTTEQLADTLAQVTMVNTVLDFKWQFGHEPFTIGERTGWLVHVSFERPDSYSKEVGRGRGRDEIIWSGTSLSGVVKTAWLLVELMVRHELMEGFRWRNRRIFNPHHTVEQLASIRQD